MDISAVCERHEQAEALRSLPEISLIFSPDDTLPYVFRAEDAGKCEPMLSRQRILARSLDGIGFLKEHGYCGEVYADHTLYTFNRTARNYLLSLGVKQDTAPLELGYNELKKRGMTGSALTVYGRIPMMISAGCIYRNSANDTCSRKADGHEIILTDRMRTDFPVLCCCRYCYNILLNSVPLSLHGEMKKVMDLDPGSLRLYFTVETPEETKETAEYFIRLVKRDGNDPAPPYDRYTKGRFIKGVE